MLGVCPLVLRAASPGNQSAPTVTVNGWPPDTGRPVGEAFTLHWHLQACHPLHHDTELSGEVALTVVRLGHAYVATVRPLGLRVTSAASEDVLTEAFEARLTAPAGPSAPDSPMARLDR